MLWIYNISGYWQKRKIEILGSCSIFEHHCSNFEQFGYLLPAMEKHGPRGPLSEA